MKCSDDNIQKIFILYWIALSFLVLIIITILFQPIFIERKKHNVFTFINLKKSVCDVNEKFKINGSVINEFDRDSEKNYEIF
jgi:hypothetical protein